MLMRRLSKQISGKWVIKQKIKNSAMVFRLNDDLERLCNQIPKINKLLFISPTPPLVGRIAENSCEGVQAPFSFSTANITFELLEMLESFTLTNSRIKLYLNKSILPKLKTWKYRNVCKTIHITVIVTFCWE